MKGIPIKIRLDIGSRIELEPIVAVRIQDQTRNSKKKVIMVCNLNVHRVQKVRTNKRNELSTTRYGIET